MNPLPVAITPLLRAGARLLSPGGGRGSLLVLMYHRVLPEPDPLLPDEPDAARFEAQLRLVSGLCHVVRLSDAIEQLSEGKLPPRAAAVTFDDGYVNNLDVAVPVLRSMGLTATFYVATGFVEGEAMFNDVVIESVRSAPDTLDLRGLGLPQYELSSLEARRRTIDDLLPRLKYLEPGERRAISEQIAARAGATIPRGLMMDTAGLRRLAQAGMEVGAHSVSHPILARLAPDQARREISASKEQLERICGRPVRSFAYPNGRPGRDYGPEHAAMVREAGFANAVSTAWGKATRATNPFEIPRIAPWDRTAMRYGLRLLRSYAAGPG
jgi:peptidoglycan/xylan/chitin deacetylase (PgdA/CDA1 family)